MADSSLMSRAHVSPRGLFVAGNISSYAAAKQQEEMRCPLRISSSAPSPQVKRSREMLVPAQEFAK